ncbi:MAG: hypothetical protein HY051_03110 [Candidatus Aenigmarchaeota archaeon]|nr:hypothetical protein [Candidatus Aenigmarchaeota archaeon]
MIFYVLALAGKDEIIESVNGWNAYAMHANTHKFRTALIKSVNNCSKKVDI